MKKYPIPVQWIQRGVVSIEGETLKDAVAKGESLDLGTLNIVGQTAPASTRVAYEGIRQYVKDEQLSDKVTLYTSSNVPNCPFCEKAKAWLEANKIDYDVVDIMIDRDKAEYAYKRTMNLAMPQLEIGNEILVGFIEENASRLAVEYGLIDAPAPGSPATPPAPAASPDPPAEKGPEIDPEIIKQIQKDDPKAIIKEPKVVKLTEEQTKELDKMQAEGPNAK